jgi:hypothetical protein
MAITYTSGAIRITGGKDSGTATSGTATTLIDTSKSWTTNAYANRMVWINGGTGAGQWRRIVSNTATVLTVDVDWDTNPSSGSTYTISYNFQDIVDAGVTGASKTGQRTYLMASPFNMINTAFLHDYEKKIAMEWGTTRYPLIVSSSSLFGLGFINENGYAFGGCQWYMRSTRTATTVSLIANTNTATVSCGDLFLYGNSIGAEVTSSQVFFFRAYSGSSQVCDIVDNQFINFEGGGRFQGTTSRFLRNTFLNSQELGSPFTIKAPFGEIDRNSVINSDYGFYWYPSIGDVTAKNMYGRNLGKMLYVFGDQTGGTCKFIDPDIDDYTITWVTSPNTTVFEQYNYVPTIKDSSEVAIEDCRIAIYDSDDTEVENDTTQADGQLTDEEILLNAGTYTQSGGDTRDNETPHTVKLRAYGYQFQEFSLSALSRTVSTVLLTDNNVTVANEATASAYTGITVNGSTETITISNDHTLQEIYDYIQWWATQETTIQYVAPMASVDGNTFILAEDWDLICDGGDITSGTGKTLGFSGTGILQLDGNTADNVAVSVGDVHLESATDLTGMTIADDLRIDTGANSTLDFDGMIVGGDVWNDSASNTLTIIGSGGSSLTAGDPGTGNGQTNILLGAQVTLTGLQANSEVRAYVGTDPATATEIDGVENSGTSFSFTQTEAGNAGYVQIHNIQYESITLDLTYGLTDQSIPIQQRFDRNYNNPT